MHAKIECILDEMLERNEMGTKWCLASRITSSWTRLDENATPKHGVAFWAFINDTKVGSENPDLSKSGLWIPEF